MLHVPRGVDARRNRSKGEHRVPSSLKLGHVSKLAVE